MRAPNYTLTVLMFLQCGIHSIASPAGFARRAASVALSPDGRTVAVGGDRTLVLFDTASGRKIRTLGGHAGAVTAVAYSPDGSMIAAAGGVPGTGGEIRLWNAKSGKAAGLLEEHSDVVHSIAFNPAGTKLVSGSYDHLALVWTLPRGPSQKVSKPVALKDHTDSVFGAAFSPDGRSVATCAADRTVKVWDAVTGKRRFTLSESTAELYSVAYSSDGKRIAAGGADRQLRVWNLTAVGGTLQKSAFAHEGAILQVAFMPNGASIITSGEDRAIKRWSSTTMAEQKVYPAQPDWPQSLSLDQAGRLLAVARHDGSVETYDVITGKSRARYTVAVAEPHGRLAVVPDTSRIPGRQLGNSQQRRPPGTGGATLFLASLGDISPLGVRRGTTTRMTFSGSRLKDALAVLFDDPAITGKLVPKDANSVHVDAVISTSARIGIHRALVQTLLGTTGSVTFAVGDWPEVGQAEPNNTHREAQKLTLPCTVTGAMDQPGDTDVFGFTAAAGDEIVFEILASPLRSRLQPVLRITDASGGTVVESKARFGKADALLGHRFDRAGDYYLELRDFESAGGGGVHYRLNVGAFPVVTEVFPLGVQRGKGGEVKIRGFNLDGKTTAIVAPPSSVGYGQTVGLDLKPSKGPLLLSERLQVGEDSEVTVDGSGHASASSAMRVGNPSTVNARLAASVEHYYRFAAKKGKPLVVEVVARRLGSPLDSEIEVLDAKGKPVERAVLRAVAGTEMVFNDRTSRGTAFRIQTWDSFVLNDLLLLGREVVQLTGLPKGPDDDIQVRGYRGNRFGFLGTTPEYHTNGTPVYKVEAHPAGSKFSPNGYPLTRINYYNDDGTALSGKDSVLEFTAPADGDYLVRVADARGQRSEEFAYRLHIHPPRPDFKVSMSPAHFNVPKGGSTVIDVESERYDGFSGPIEVKLEGLPEGFAAPTTIIQAGENTATLLLTASAEAATPAMSAQGKIRLVARARVDGREMVRTVEPENGARLVTVMPNPDIRVATDISEVVIHPGSEATVEVRIDRQGNFGARVPIAVRNLPYGVRVANIGLNGVLVTEQDTSRIFTLYCEPWVEQMSRPFYVLGDVEGGTSNGAAPLTLRVAPSASASTPVQRVRTISDRPVALRRSR